MYLFTPLAIPSALPLATKQMEIDVRGVLPTSSSAFFVTWGASFPPPCIPNSWPGPSGAWQPVAPTSNLAAQFGLAHRIYLQPHITGPSFSLLHPTYGFTIWKFGTKLYLTLGIILTNPGNGSIVRFHCDLIPDDRLCSARCFWEVIAILWAGKLCPRPPWNSFSRVTFFLSSSWVQHIFNSCAPAIFNLQSSFLQLSFGPQTIYKASVFHAQRS